MAKKKNNIHSLPDAYIEGAGVVVNEKITETLEKNYMPSNAEEIDTYKYAGCDKDYKEIVLDAIKKEKESHE